MGKYTKSTILLLIFLFAFLSLTGLLADDKGTAAENSTNNTGMSGVKPGDSSGNFNFGFGLGLGVATFGEVTYQKLALAPELVFGPFGIGLDVNIHFRFVDGAPEFRLEDWVPEDPDFFSVLGLYLAKFKYIRYGQKGDPLYIKFGSVDDFLLGTGFIVGNYTNTLFTPETRLFGMQLDLDGQLFNFPYFGLETFAGDISRFDVFGSRLYIRPLYALDIPILKNLQLGGTLAFDTAPFRYTDDTLKSTYNGLGINTADAFMVVFGADIIIPVIDIDNVFTLSTFGDLASLKGKSIGGMLGLGGKLINLITYGMQLRMLGDNFVPSYFDSSYDITRAERYRLADGAVYIPAYMSWLATLGTSISDDLFVFKLTLESPFSKVDEDPDNYLNYPQLKGLLALSEGLLPGFFFDATYDKKLIRKIEQVFTAEGALIKARINYKTGPAVISFFYQLSYSTNDWSKPEIISGLESYIQF